MRYFKFLIYVSLFFLFCNFSFAQDSSEGIQTWVEEEDGSPSVIVYKTKVTNGTLTDNFDGTASISISGTGAPTDADYFVGTANGSLSAEIVVGTTPGGELGNTWASPFIDDSVTVTGWELGASTATTPSTDDNDTSLGTTAYVQTELNAAGGRSLACASGSCDADAELYTDFVSKTIETPTDADNFLIFEAPFALTVTRVQAIVEAATSAVITWQECDAAGDNCTTIESVTADVDGVISTTIDGAGIDAGDTIRLDVGTVTGTVGHVSSTLVFTKDD